MKLYLVAVGKPKGPARPAIVDYEARVGRYFGYESVEVAPGRGDPHATLREEAAGLLAKLPTDSRVYALTRLGERYTSPELAAQLEELATYGPGAAVFVIGGAFGLDAQVLDRADRRFSLSDLTLPHDLARLVLLEQLYRAGTIMRGEPYHKGG